MCDDFGSSEKVQDFYNRPVFGEKRLEKTVWDKVRSSAQAAFISEGVGGAAGTYVLLWLRSCAAPAARVSSRSRRLVYICACTTAGAAAAVAVAAPAPAAAIASAFFLCFGGGIEKVRL